jgi:LysM repeat protein
MRRNDEFEIVDIEGDFTDDAEHASRNRNEETNPIQEWYEKLKIPYAKLKQVEGNLNRLLWIEARLDQMEEKIKEFEVMMNTLEKFGISSTQPHAKSPEAVAKALYHRVRVGETLYGISRRYGVTIEELRRLNKLSQEATIYPDQKLLIRQGDSK